jgi:two-component system cell cycle response regulator DivK
VARFVSHTRLKDPGAGGVSPLILVVDDCFDTRALHSECLLEAGYRVASAADGNSALSLALSAVPDLVLLDLQMPGLDGWETARLMRSYFPTRPIPIIAVSGLDDSATVKRAKAAGCDRFVPKPCTPEELLRVIQSALIEADEKQSDALAPT